jgi:neutral ceramidase
MRQSLVTIQTALLAVLAVGAALVDTTEIIAADGKGEPARMFRAGAAASNITPPIGLLIAGPSSRKPATHIHDELYAKCVVLDDGETRIAWVLADNLGMSREVCDAAREMIFEHTGIRRENVMVAGTHTHSSVSARGVSRMVLDQTLDDYQQFLAKRIADGVRRAVNNLEPARIGWGSAQEPTQVFNRRYHMKPGTPVPNPFGGEDKVRMNPGIGNPDILKAAGPTDPEVAFLSIQSTDGRPIALVANYSLHYVGTYAGQAISADYFGVFGDRIQQLLSADRLDPPFVGVMSNGTSADILSIDWPRKPEKKWGPYERMRHVADLVAQAVYKTHQETEFHDWVKLAAAQEGLTLAVRKPSDEQLAHARQILAKPEDADPYHKDEKSYAQRVLKLHEWPDEIAVPLQAFRIGDLGVCALPFEVFVETGLEMKAKGPLGQTFVISHANGSYGYLPTVEQHSLGGYETWMGTNTVEIEAAPKIVDRLLALFASLK